MFECEHYELLFRNNSLVLHCLQEVLAIQSYCLLTNIKSLQTIATGALMRLGSTWMHRIALMSLLLYVNLAILGELHNLIDYCDGQSLWCNGGNHEWIKTFPLASNVLPLHRWMNIATADRTIRWIDDPGRRKSLVGCSSIEQVWKENATKWVFAQSVCNDFLVPPSTTSSSSLRKRDAAYDYLKYWITARG